MIRFIHHRMPRVRSLLGDIKAMQHRNYSSTSSNKLSYQTERPFLSHLIQFQDKIAVIQTQSTNSLDSNELKSQERIYWTYADILRSALQVHSSLVHLFATNPYGASPRVALWAKRDVSFIVQLFAIWLSGGMAIPLHPQLPSTELSYIIENSKPHVFILNKEEMTSIDNARIDWLTTFQTQFPKTKLVQLCTPGQLIVEKPSSQAQESGTYLLSSSELSEISKCILNASKLTSEIPPIGHDDALMVYTSGTTGRPKGVVLTHKNLLSQMQAITQTWDMTSNDHILHFLPLHHVHGILNKLLCIAYAGGSLEFLSTAAPTVIWKKLQENVQKKDFNGKHKNITMMMAVPTIYMKLLEQIEEWQLESSNLSPRVEECLAGAQSLRVMISGSMACPLSILKKWEALTGHRLLERYGMTEIGMALTNPLIEEKEEKNLENHLPSHRHFGYVGSPFPSVNVRVVDPDTEIEIGDEREGELRVKGPNVFREYWQNPQATSKAFDKQGWFKTGDIVQYNIEKSSFAIRGRASADILKSGGYKISALDIERVLLSHPQIQEASVVGLPDEKWGQIVAAIIRTTPEYDEKSLSPTLETFTKSNLASYERPRRVLFMQEIPKNAMGKINKKKLIELFNP